MVSQKFIDAVGFIPDDWQTMTLSDVCTKGGIVRGPFGGALKKEIFVSEGYKVYEQGNAINHTVEYGRYFVDENKYREMLRFAVKEGDFIVSCSGTIGRIFQIPAGHPKGIINQALLKLTTNEKVICDQFFYYYFSWDQFNGRVIDDTQGGAMKNLVGMKEFKKTNLAMPATLEEQQAIAIALSDVDELIANLEKLIEKKKAIKQGTMQELLTGKKRLPGYNGEWVKHKLGDLLKYEQPTKYIVRSTEYTDNGIPVLTAGKTFVLGYTDETDGIYSSLPVIIFDDFVTSSKLVDFRFKVKSSAMKMLTPKSNDVNLRLVFELMQMIDFTPTDHQRHWISRYSKFEISLPSDLEEQNALAVVFSDMDAEIDKMRSMLEKYRLVKQSMMQKLLTGEIRLM